MFLPTIFQIIEAEQWFLKSIELVPSFRSALFNLALLLTETGRPGDAVGPLNQLLLHHPDHVKALILLGDIHTNHVRDLDKAEDLYQRWSYSEINNL